MISFVMADLMRGEEMRDFVSLTEERALGFVILEWKDMVPWEAFDFGGILGGG